MPTPESPKLNNREYLTREGYDELKKELDDLEKRLLPEVAKELEEAIKDGDITENAAYQTAKEKQAMLYGKINELEGVLSRAEIISKEKSAEVQLGSLVRLQKENSGETEEYLLVGPEEADSLKGKISYKFPLGDALLGKKEGEKIQVLTPKGKINYTIINVE